MKKVLSTPRSRPAKKASDAKKSASFPSSAGVGLENYIDLFDFAPVGYLVLDRNGLIHQANLTSAEMLHMDRDGMILQPLQSFISTEFHLTFNDFLKKVFKSNVKEICKISLIREDNKPFFVLLEAVPAADGKVCRVIVLDITARGQLEAQFAYQATVLANMSDAVISTDSELNIRSWNHAAEVMYGWTEQEVLGKTIDAVCQTEFIDTTAALAQAELIERGVWRGEVTQQRKDGTLFYAYASVASIRDTHGSIIGGITINTDITERKKEQEALASSEAELRALFASIRDAVMVIDKDGVYRRIAPTNPSLLYKPTQEMLGKRLEDIFDTKQSRYFIKTIQNVLKTNQPIQIEYELVINKLHFWFETSISPMPNNNTLWVARDITERKSREKELRETKNLLEKTFASLDQAVFVVERKTRNVLACNPAVERIFGYREYEVIGHNTQFMYANRADYEHYPDELIPALDTHSVYHVEVQMCRKDGTIFPAEVTETGILDDDGVRTGVVSVIRDITERKQAEERLTYLSTHDGLTGLYNRGYFDETLTRLEGGRQYPISIVMVDVDHMKMINDSLGHIAGDIMLKNVSRILTTAFRTEDIVARIGGDEFAVVMPNTGETEAKKVLHRVRHVLHQHNSTNNSHALSLSMGVSTTNQKIKLSDLLKKADAEMYADKPGLSRTSK